MYILNMLKAILFDFDGVIVDSNEHSIHCFQKTFEYFNKPVPSSEEILQHNGHTVFNILKSLMPDEKDEKIHEMHDIYKGISDKTFTMIRLVDGVEEVIKELGAGYKLAVVSSRRSESLHKLLLHHNLNSYFSIILGREDVIRHKPHPEGIMKVLKKFELRQEESIFIGDSEQDVLAAHNAGILCVIISKSKENIGGDYRIYLIKELPELLRNIN